MSSLDLGLEDVHVFLNADLGERMEVVAVVNEFLAHSSTSSCERKACESLGECVVHSNAEVDDVGSGVCECELQLRSLNSICEHADTSIRLRFGDVVPCGAFLGHFNSELGRIQIALYEVAERERASELGTDKRKASDVVPESCEPRVIRSCRSEGGEVLRRILELLVHLLQTVVGCEALCAVPRCGAVGFQSVGLGLEGLVCSGIRRSCCKSVDKSGDGIAGYIAGGRIRVGRIHVHGQVACKRLACCESDSGSERSDVVLFKRVVLQMRRIVCVRRVGAGDCNLVACSRGALVEISNLRGRDVQRPAADVADTGHLSRIGRSELNCRRRNCRRRSCIVEQLLHFPCEGALCAVVVHDLEVEASTLRKKLLHVERERRLAHVAHSCRRICFCAVAGDGACDSGVAGGLDSSGGGNYEGGLSSDAGPVDDLRSEGAVLLLEVDISGCRHSDVLRGRCGCVEAGMRGTCSPVSDTPGLVGGCRHDHALRSDAGVRYSAVSDAILGVEVGAVLVLADTCFDNAVRSLLHCNSACEVDLRDSLLDHAVVVLDVNPCLREKRGVDLSCILIDEPVHHSELRLRIQQVLATLKLYIFFCHVVFLIL